MSPGFCNTYVYQICSRVNSESGPWMIDWGIEKNLMLRVICFSNICSFFLLWWANFRCFEYSFIKGLTKDNCLTLPRILLMHIPVNVTLDKSGSLIVLWRHQMETIFAFLTLVGGTTGGFPSQMASKAGFHVSVAASLNKYSSRRWFETPRCLMWRRCHGNSIGLLEISRVTLKDMHSANCKNFAVQSWCDGGKSQENPSSTGGVLAVMDHLHTFVPTNGDRVLPILCSGDGLSMERMISAHHNRTVSATATGRVEGFKETPSEFHKETLLM